MNKKRFPFGIPTGWFQVGYTSELAVGQVVPLSYFNTELVMFRTSDGTAHVLDAFCPHLGAHLGSMDIGRHGDPVSGRHHGRHLSNPA